MAIPRTATMVSNPVARPTATKAAEQASADVHRTSPVRRHARSVVDPTGAGTCSSLTASPSRSHRQPAVHPPRYHPKCSCRTAAGSRPAGLAHLRAPRERHTGSVQEEVTESRPGLTLMADHGVDIPVWYGPGGDSAGGPDADELAAWGVSDRLINRLRAWAEAWDHDPFTSNAAPGHREGSPTTVRLAQHLQTELPGYRIFLFDGRRRRPIDEWNG